MVEFGSFTTEYNGFSLTDPPKMVYRSTQEFLIQRRSKFEIKDVVLDNKGNLIELVVLLVDQI